MKKTLNIAPDEKPEDTVIEAVAALWGEQPDKSWVIMYYDSWEQIFDPDYVVTEEMMRQKEAEHRKKYGG